MIYKMFPLVIFALMSFTSDENRSVPTTKIINAKIALLATNDVASIDTKVAAIYSKLQSNNFALPKMASFSEALEGFYALKQQGRVQKDILTLIDFTMPSSAKRLWIIDLTTNTVLMNSLVAHGKNTGEDMATSFSNDASSFKSSLGFYVTGEIYTGKHGKSLKLDGLEKGINDNARNRGVVMHAADYVSDSFVRDHHRLGRSQGCPAVPAQLTDEIIDLIKNKSCLFIYHPSHKLKAASKLLS